MNAQQIIETVNSLSAQGKTAGVIAMTLKIKKVIVEAIIAGTASIQEVQASIEQQLAPVDRQDTSIAQRQAALIAARQVEQFKVMLNGSNSTPSAHIQELVDRLVVNSNEDIDSDEMDIMFAGEHGVNSIEHIVNCWHVATGSTCYSEMVKFLMKNLDTYKGKAQDYFNEEYAE